MDILKESRADTTPLVPIVIAAVLAMIVIR